MLVSCIVAVSENGVKGKNGTLPWRLSSDLKRFKEITTGHHIILGRKNYEDIGRPLPNRINLVLSRKENLKIEGCEVFSSLEHAINFAKESGETECFIIGGAEIYKAAMPYCSRLYLTKVKAEIDGDVFMPSLGEGWTLERETSFPADEKNQYSTVFQIFERSLKNG